MMIQRIFAFISLKINFTIYLIYLISFSPFKAILDLFLKPAIFPCMFQWQPVVNYLTSILWPAGLSIGDSLLEDGGLLSGDLLAVRDEGGLFVPTMKSGCCSAVVVEPHPFFCGSALWDLDLLQVRILKVIPVARHIWAIYLPGHLLSEFKLVQMVPVFICVRQSFGMLRWLNSLVQ